MTLDALLRDILRDEIRTVVREELRAQAPQSAPDELISITQAAAQTGYSTSTIRKWFDDGSLKRYGEGRNVRVNKAELFAKLAPKPAAPGSERAVNDKAAAIVARFR